MYYVYILKIADKGFYIGYSADLKGRIKAHLNNTVKQTKKKSFRLVFYAAFENKLKALQFEKYLKQPSGFAFRNKRLI